MEWRDTKSKVFWDGSVLSRSGLYFYYICAMSGTVRQQKFARLIQKELSLIFLRDKKGILEKELITIAEVRMSPDLAVARVYISMMMVKDKQMTLQRLNVHKGAIRRALGSQIRKQVRIIPELIFAIDEVEENALHIESLIDNLHIPPSPAPKKEE